MSKRAELLSWTTSPRQSLIPDEFENEHRVHEYEYRCEDKSLAQPFMVHFLRKYILRYIPLSVSPNALTIVGFSAGLLVWSTLWFQYDRLQGGAAAPFLFFGMAFCLLFYAMLDQLDGMQARRQDRSSPLGDFVDHWCDALLMNLIVVAAFMAINVTAPITIAVAFLGGLCFWANNFETRDLGTRRLPSFGGLELLLFGALSFVLCGILGVDAWSLPLFGIPFYFIPTLAIVGFLLRHSSRYLAGWSDRFLDLVGFFAAVLPLAIWAMIEGLSDGSKSSYALPVLLMGLVSTKLTGDVIRHHLIGTRFRSFDPWLIVPSMMLGVQAVSGVYAEATPILCGVFVAVVALRLLHQFAHTWRHVHRTLPSR